MAHPNFNTSVNLIQDEYILESNAYMYYKLSHKI